MDDTVSTKPAPGDPALDAEKRAHIGRQLQLIYNELLNRAIPQRLLELLERQPDSAPPSTPQTKPIQFRVLRQ